LLILLLVLSLRMAGVLCHSLLCVVFLQHYVGRSNDGLGEPFGRKGVSKTALLLCAASRAVWRVGLLLAECELHVVVGHIVVVDVLLGEGVDIQSGAVLPRLVVRCQPLARP